MFLQEVGRLVGTGWGNLGEFPFPLFCPLRSLYCLALTDVLPQCG